MRRKVVFLIRKRDEVLEYLKLKKKKMGNVKHMNQTEDFQHARESIVFYTETLLSVGERIERKTNMGTAVDNWGRNLLLCGCRGKERQIQKGNSLHPVNSVF